MIQKICTTCSATFVIEPDDLTFYAKIDVPPPTLCPECRMRRRMLHFNERTLFKSTCKLCGKEVISAHRPDALYPVYCQPCWWSDKWDAMIYGREYDFSRSFFDQYRELRDSVPLPALNNIYSSNLNSEYVNMCSYVKNCYLCFNTDFTEDSSFSCYLEQSKRCLDVDHGLQCELCYDSIGLYKCYNVKYSANLDDCIDVWFSRDLKNCSNCFGCVNLRGKQYCIWNEQKTKDEYFEELKKYDLTSREGVEKLKKKLETFYQNQPHKYMTGVGNVNVTGDYIFWSKNVRDSYDIVGAEDCKQCQFFIIEGSKNCMDVTMWGSHLMEAYECCGVGNKQNNFKFCFESWNEASNMTYCSRILTANSDCFGCIGIRNKQYCILNMQYTREEYEALTAKIISKMKAEGEYGEFFPATLAAIGYNESFANKYRPMMKEEAMARGYLWHEPEKRQHQVGGDVIACGHEGMCQQQCSSAFRLTQSEKDFYNNQGIPLPALCPNCRHYERLIMRTPVRFASRTCMKCGKGIVSGYPADGKEMIYCEQCYQTTVI